MPTIFKHEHNSNKIEVGDTIEHATFRFTGVVVKIDKEHYMNILRDDKVAGSGCTIFVTELECPSYSIRAWMSERSMCKLVRKGNKYGGDRHIAVLQY